MCLKHEKCSIYIHRFILNVCQKFEQSTRPVRYVYVYVYLNKQNFLFSFHHTNIFKRAAIYKQFLIRNNQNHRILRRLSMQQNLNTVLRLKLHSQKLNLDTIKSVHKWRELGNGSSELFISRIKAVVDISVGDVTYYYHPSRLVGSHPVRTQGW